MSSADDQQSNATATIFALDFDGVLVDSAAETGHSGWLAAKALWPDATCTWMSDDRGNKEKQQLPAPLDLIQRFCQVRPCLETGWEASLIIRLLADPKYGKPSNDEIVRRFQSVYKEQILQDSQLTPDQCNQALKQVRNDWIAQNNGQDWIQAHVFFEGACQAVRQLLETEGNENVYIITTKAKDFALRLLEQQHLYDGSNTGGSGSSSRTKKAKTTTILNDHIYGLGSGPKATVLVELLSKKTQQQQQQQQKSVVAIMVEDNLSTLHKIVANPELQGRTLPVLASWGYNTFEQQHEARNNDHFVVLDSEDSSSLSRVLDSRVFPALWKEFLDHCRP